MRFSPPFELLLRCQAECSPLRDRERENPKRAAEALLSRRVPRPGRHRTRQNEEESRLFARSHYAGKGVTPTFSFHLCNLCFLSLFHLHPVDFNLRRFLIQFAFQVCLGKIRDQGKKKKTLKTFVIGLSLINF